MRNLISILLLIVLFLLTPVVLTLNVAKQNILTTSFLKREFAKLDVYGLAISQLDKHINKIQIDPQYPITNAEIAELVHQVLSRTWLQQNVEAALNSVDTWLRQPAGTELSVTIDLTQPKRQLATSVDTLLTEKLPQIQPCDKKLPKEERGICQFSGMTVEQVKTELGRQGLSPDVITTLLPDKFDLVHPDLSKITGEESATDPNSADAKSQEIRKNLEQFKARYQQVTFLLTWSLVIWGLVFLLYLVINDTGWHHFVRWAGVGFLIISLFPLAAALSSGALAEFLIPKIQIASDTPPEVARLIPLAIRDARLALALPLGIIGGLSFGLGLGGIIGAHWVRTTSKKAKGLPKRGVREVRN